jgi:hypothetical protein
MAKTSTRAARIAGKLLYGDIGCQSPLARLTGLSPASNAAGSSPRLRETTARQRSA